MDDDDLEIERNAVRSKIKNMSADELKKMKEEISEQISSNSLQKFKKTHRKRMFSRETKGSPLEVSSKLPASYYRPKFEGKKFKVRDPRFDPKCGTYDENHFKEHFKFVDELKNKEVEILKKQLTECEDSEEKKKIKFLIQRLTNQLREKAKREKQIETQIKEKKTIKEQKEKGEKPTYYKKSEKKILSLLTKYEELKADKKIEKHVQKMVKKSKKKDRINVKIRD